MLKKFDYIPKLHYVQKINFLSFQLFYLFEILIIEKKIAIKESFLSNQYLQSILQKRYDEFNVAFKILKLAFER